jgi:hypothetical protein
LGGACRAGALDHERQFIKVQQKVIGEILRLVRFNLSYHFGNSDEFVLSIHFLPSNPLNQTLLYAGVALEIVLNRMRFPVSCKFEMLSAYAEESSDIRMHAQKIQFSQAKSLF